MHPAVDSPLLLAAPTPQEWLARHLRVHLTRHAAPDPARVWLSRAELLAADAAALRASHAKLCASGDPAAAAAKWIAGWFPGAVADAVGFTLATAGAALLPDTERIRWRMDPGGWPDLFDPADAGMAVARTHPWAGLAGVRVLPDEQAVAALAAATVTELGEPLIRACRTLARVGTTALWAEVADSFGLAMLFDLDLPVDAAAVNRIRWGLTATGVRWRQRPELWMSGDAGSAEYLGRKAGCCLAYQCPPGPGVDLDTLPEQDRSYYQRFPPSAEPRYCSTCSLRDLDDCADRQSHYLTLQRAARR